MASNITNNINSNTTLFINALSSSAVNIGAGGGLTTVASGLTSTDGTTTLGVTNVQALTGSSTASFSGLVTLSGGLTGTAGTSSLGALNATTGTFSGLLEANSGLTSTTGTTSLGPTTFAASSIIDINGNTVSNLGAPSAATDAANKMYVDSVAQGLATKESVVVATVVPGVLATSFASGQTIDGVVLTTGNRILVKDQTNGIENGIYDVTIGTPTRSFDLNTGNNAGGSYTFVSSGTVNSNQGFVCSNVNNVNDVVGTDSLTFTQFTGVAEIDVSTGLVKSGNTLSIDPVQTSFTTVTLATGGSGLNTSSTSTTLGNTTFAATSTISIGNNILTSVGDPVNPQDAVTKSFLDNNYNTNSKKSVTVATVSAVDLATSFANGQTVDGVVLVTGNRVLVKNQTNGIENGVYVVNVSGSPTRATDFSSGTGVSGAVIHVTRGTANAGLYFICTNISGSDMVNSNSLTFLSGLVAGTGLTGTGSTLSVNSNQSQITNVGTLVSLNVSGMVTSGSATVNGVNITPNPNDIIAQQTFSSITNPVAAATNVTGLLISNTSTGSFIAYVNVVVSATANLYEFFQLVGINKGNGWYFNQESYGPTPSSGITFSITSGGQIQYTQTSVSGFTGVTMKFKVDTITV